MQDKKKAYIVLYGASLTGQVALQHYGKEKVRCFCDGDSKKVGTLVDGIKVISKEQLLEIKDEIELVITSNKHVEIVKDLRRLGISDYKLFCIKKSTCSPEEQEEYSKLRVSVRTAFMQCFSDKPLYSD